MKLRALDPLLYPDKDILHKDFVDHFYHLIKDLIEPPYAISLDGLWGTGKTTIMKALESKLRGAGYPVFWFNPWEYRQSDNVVVAFLRKLATENRSFLDEMKKRSGKTILAVLAETAMDVGLSKLTDGKVSLGDIRERFQSVEEKQTFSFTDYDDIVETIKKEFIELVDRISQQHEDKPVIIFFDDLDRCLPDDAIKLLEALKNLFVTKIEKPKKRKCNAIFICGIDTHIAKKFIQEHYNDIEENFAINYFRKIFNLTISMPHSPDIKKLITEHIEELGWKKQESQNLADKVYNAGLQADMSSIRKYLNLINNFYTFQTFNPDCTSDEEKDFALHLLIVKEAWQPLYEIIVKKALKERTKTTGDLIREMLKNCEVENYPLTEQAKAFLSYYFARDTSSFHNLKLAEDFLYKYPTLT